MKFRRIAMLVDADIRLSAALTALPGVEVYHVANEDEIDMALLNDLHSPCKLAFVGGNLAEHFARLYHGTWIALEADLLRFWESGA
jgi:hypothetical protein